MIKNKTVTGQSSPGTGFWAGLSAARSHRAHRRTAIISKNLNEFTTADITNCHKHGAYDNTHLPPYNPEGQKSKMDPGTKIRTLQGWVPSAGAEEGGPLLPFSAPSGLFLWLKAPSSVFKAHHCNLRFHKGITCSRVPGIRRLWRFRVILSIYRETEWVQSLRLHQEGIRGSSPSWPWLHPAARLLGDTMTLAPGNYNRIWSSKMGGRVRRHRSAQWGPLAKSEVNSK